MRMRQGVRTGLGHGGITCVLQTQFSSLAIHSQRLDLLLSKLRGWSGRAMVLGTFQCRDALLVWTIKGQESMVHAVG